MRIQTGRIKAVLNSCLIGKTSKEGGGGAGAISKELEWGIADQQSVRYCTSIPSPHTSEDKTVRDAVVPGNVANVVVMAKLVVGGCFDEVIFGRVVVVVALGCAGGKVV